DRVEVNYQGKGKYFPGRVTRDRGDGTFDITYEDGDSEARVLKEWVRLVEAAPGSPRSPAVRRMEEGDRVEANYRGKGMFLPGSIQRRRLDGTFDVCYHDGETETDVKEESIRFVGDQPPARGHQGGS
ncbi:hypothetical protein EON64_09515, partial [archaeon]